MFLPVKPILYFAAMLLPAFKLNAQCTASISPNTLPICVASGSSVTLTGGYSSGTPTGYTWYLNGNAVAGATNATYNAAVAGNYSVTITNGSCSATSASVPVSVYTPIVITPNVVNVCQGTPYLIGCPTPPGPGYIYQWQLNGSAISGATSQNYSANASGVYTVTVINASTGQGASPCVVTSNPVTINYIPLPSAAITASANSICQGDTAVLCGSSTTGLTYNWAGPTAFTTATTQCIHAYTGGIYTLSVVNSYGCVASSSDTLTVNPVPAAPVAGANSPVAIGDTIQFNAQSSTASVAYHWNGPGGFTTTVQNPAIYNATAAMSGTYGVYVSQNGCNSPFAFVPVWVTDFVWPGDANYDQLVDNNDILAIALAYSNTGPGRAAGTISWTPQACNDWGTSLPGGINMKHADCNGDSTVNAADTLAVSQNYGQVHNRGAHYAQAKVTGLPDLYFDTNGILFTAGTTVSIPVKLGNAATPINQLLGLAAQIHVSGLALNTPPRIVYNNSWLATNNQSLQFSKAISNSRLDWAFARNDHQDAGGYGTIATLVLDIPAAGTGTAVLSFDGIAMVDKNGNAITAFNVLDDTITVHPLEISGPVVSPLELSVLPNPSHGRAQLSLNLPQAGMITCQVTDISGKVVAEQQYMGKAGVQRIDLPATGFAAGIYHITVKGKNFPAEQVKWIKQD